MVKALASDFTPTITRTLHSWSGNIHFHIATSGHRLLPEASKKSLWTLNCSNSLIRHSSAELSNTNKLTFTPTSHEDYPSVQHSEDRLRLNLSSFFILVTTPHLLLQYHISLLLQLLIHSTLRPPIWKSNGEKHCTTRWDSNFFFFNCLYFFSICASITT